MNEAAIRGVVESIINDPASFDMSNWAKRTNCGTVMCVAGHACHNAGLQFAGSAFNVYMNRVLVGTEVKYISNAAQDLLGLTDIQAEDIFQAIYWCASENVLSNLNYCDSSFYESDHSHAKATPRQTIENIAKVTGLEFKIPDWL